MSGIQAWDDTPSMEEQFGEIDMSSKGPASMREGDGMMAALKNVVAAWEALPGGDHRYHVVEQWLRRDMKPAIDAARAAILSATQDGE